MIDLFLQYAADHCMDEKLSAAIAGVLDSAGRGRADLVETAERAVQADPTSSFSFDAAGFATLRVGDESWQAGRFETPSIAELRQRVREPGGGGDRVRLWVLDGAGAATDIGGLQATAAPGTLFQAASQFNCLESPGPYVTPVVQYFRDNTQGPRASISAFPGTLLRHYAAPRNGDGRFVQTDADQVNLLDSVFGPEVAQVQSGYLMGRNVRDAAGLVAALTSNFESIRVGVHEGVQVVLGYDFEGSVDDSETRRIAQVDGGGRRIWRRRIERRRIRRGVSAVVAGGVSGDVARGRGASSAVGGVDADRGWSLRESGVVDLAGDSVGGCGGCALGFRRIGRGCERTESWGSFAAGANFGRGAGAWRGGVGLWADGIAGGVLVNGSGGCLMEGDCRSSGG
jgi:hypothetical protein